MFLAESCGGVRASLIGVSDLPPDLGPVGARRFSEHRFWSAAERGSSIRGNARVRRGGADLSIVWIPLSYGHGVSERNDPLAVVVACFTTPQLLRWLTRFRQHRRH